MTATDMRASVLETEPPVKGWPAAALLLPAAMALPAVAVAGFLSIPLGPGANQHLNEGLAASLSAVQRRSGCPGDVAVDPRLESAARRHAIDLASHHIMGGDVGSDGSTPAERAREAGFTGTVTEVVSLRSPVGGAAETILAQWVSGGPEYAACATTAVGVWAADGPTGQLVVAALYGLSADAG